MRRRTDSRDRPSALGLRGGTTLVLLLSLSMLLTSCGTGGLAVKRDVWEAEAGFEQRQASLS